MRLADQQTDTDSTNGIIYKGTSRFIHNFRHPTGDTARPIGHNTFVGINAGNLTMGSTATATAHGSYNVGIGTYALHLNTTGSYNTASGPKTLYANTSGNSNTASGYVALYSNTTGYANTASGYYALYSNTTGNYNTASGYYALYSNTTGYVNTASGRTALYSNTTGNYNTASGYVAGRYISGGGSNETGNNSVFLGYDTRALADGQTNQIVIGSGAVGIGSNSVVLGNDSIVTTALKGDVGIGTTSPSATLDVNGSLSKNSGSFLIDHPLEPTEKLLRYGFVESPRYDLIHRGRVTLKDGKATVNIDKEYGLSVGTFEALTQNAQVTSLLPVNSFVRVKASEIKGCEFTIQAEEKVSMDVNWVVIAERNDVYIRNTDETDENGHLINEIEKEEFDESKLEKEIIEVEDEKEVGIEYKKIDVSNKKGYYRSMKEYGQEPVTREIEKVLKENIEEEIILLKHNGY